MAVEMGEEREEKVAQGVPLGTTRRCHSHNRRRAAAAAAALAGGAGRFGGGCRPLSRRQPSFRYTQPLTTVTTSVAGRRRRSFCPSSSHQLNQYSNKIAIL